jgi:FkbH-like protein
MNSASLEAVRLVIWDLDETFWHGTLTEGGIRYQQATHDIVVELARRGIVSSICSRNDTVSVRNILQRETLWDYFVFPSISWDAKGPRLATLVNAVQLRPATVLFIDDNPANLAEAQRFVPGIQVADPTLLPGLLNDPRFRGKSDPGLARLAQYRLLQTRQADAAQATDNTAFLRESGIVVTIEPDVEAHLDRAIELINRTNQLNFTKQRLPEDLDKARAALRNLLSRPAWQGALVRVRDRYGDQGYCGFYAIRNARGMSRELQHFCFSCRILGMGVETWLYRRLGRPDMRVEGDVLSDPVAESAPGQPEIDWISAGTGAPRSDSEAVLPTMDIAYLRGACHMRPMSHFFAQVARQVVEAFDTVRDGRTMPLNHSLFAHYALHGVPPAARPAFARLGYIDEDFTNFDPNPPADQRGVWMLNFWTELKANVYRHTATGALIPLGFGAGVAERVLKAMGPAGIDACQWDPATPGVDPDLLTLLREEFSFVGALPDDILLRNITGMIDHAPAGVAVVLLLANEVVLRPDGATRPAAMSRRINDIVRQAAALRPRAMVVAAQDSVRSNSDLVVDQPLKLQPAVSFRIYEDVVRRWSAFYQPSLPVTDGR